MGLHITGMRSRKEYSRSYGALHFVRYLGAIACGFEGDYDQFKEIEHGDRGNQRTWGMFPQCWQLMHFSDDEGVLIPEHALNGVDYRLSWMLGSSTKLYNELKFIRDDIAREHGCGVLYFS